MKKIKDNKSLRIIYNLMPEFVGCLVIFTISMISIGKKHGMWYGDEFGFVSVAAFLNGFDWSEQVSYLGYYGIGYGFLLAPLFFLSENLRQFMTLTTVFNAFLLVCSYLFSVDVHKIIFPNQEKRNIILLSLLSVLYVSNLAHLNMAWSEEITVFFYWALLDFLCRLIAKNQMVYLYLSVIFSCFSVIIHMRNITLAFTMLICVVIYIVKNKRISIKHIIFSCILFALGVIFFSMSKEYAKVHIFMNQSKLQSNDIGYVSQIAGRFNINELRVILDSIAYKGFYFMSTSFFFGVLGICYAVKNIFNKNNKYNTVYVFVILSFAFAFFTTVFFMRQGIRKDNYFYSRYYEASIGMLLPLGVLEVKRILDYSSKTVLCIPIILYKILFAFVSNGYSQLCSNPHIKGFITLCVPGMTPFILLNDEKEVIRKMFMMIFFLYIVIFFCIVILKNSNLSIYLMISIVFAFWIFSYVLESNHTMIETNKRYESIFPIVEEIETEWKSNCNNEIFFIKDGEWNEILLSFQAEIGKTPIKNVNSLSDIKDKDNIYVLVEKKQLFDTQLEREFCLNKLSETNQYILYFKKE